MIQTNEGNKMRKVFLAILALLVMGCGGPSAEYKTDAEAILKKMDAACEVLRAGSRAKEPLDALDYAHDFSTEHLFSDDGIDATCRAFVKKWDAKDEGQLESFKQIAALQESMSDQRKQLTRAMPDTINGALEDAYLETRESIDKTRRFLAEGK